MKLKTHKMTAKKIKVTGAKKLMTHHAGHDHFNAREPGRVTRHKRRGRPIAKADDRNVRLQLPYTTN